MKQTIIYKNKIYKIDIGFIAILLILACTSFFAIYNAFNLIKTGSGTFYLIKQMMWYVISFILMSFLCSFSNDFIFKYIKKAYYILIGCLVYLLLSRIVISLTGARVNLPFAPMINGAVSWISIPGASFQPSEFIKIVLIVMVAQIIAKHNEQYPEPSYKEDLGLIIEIAKVLLPPLILILLQPDTGLCIIICFTILIMLMCSGIRKGYIVSIFVALGIVVALFLFIYYNQRDLLVSLISNYRVQRIDAWLDPESNILGSSNQLYTALLSLGSAGFLGFGSQANIISIPEAQTDFIFAAFGQCFGFLGTLFIVVVCLVLDLYLCKIAYNTVNQKDRLIVIGVIGMLIYQQLQNIGMIVGLMPITGITLPLISYGGSSTLSYFIAFSFVMNLSPVSKRTFYLGKRKTRLKKSR
ncbi:MAG: FtsW/RodA/SpoVE family cell cycle protein [Erysipelotrichaceae bacterium]|uniref:FtsW/RodA/SpoVE family cell cycle protein n=1 Tax=Floccifex sp. TaxID=2815810 RepID=UPI002A75195C|nr:FtsW/RodA/SpoVE family cell cycle protein [Floccifex sp.]MDD7280483.1 FtsW/RodA/SpoVE family cell cycle protein [Erysipelotrichaceae bacterium]MDY2958670.1 FtsW/RodA/SpoVE family cell cycle protein [Floccifex sp.]